MSVESLTQALLDAGMIDASSADARLARARTARALLEGIVADGLMTENGLVSQLARALSVPRYDPSARAPEPDALALVDRHRMAELGVLPVALRSGGTLLWVATPDPTDEETMAEVALVTGRRIKPCLIGPREFERALKMNVTGEKRPQPTQAFVAPNTLERPPAAPSSSPQNPSPPQSTADAPTSVQTRLQQLENELAQTRDVVRVLSQMLVERGALDGDEFKRRLRAERK